MSKKTNTPAATAPVEAEAPMAVTFGKPYHFEGKDYTGIDLSGLDNLTAENMIAADKYLTTNGSFSVMPEMSMGYTLYIASMATGLPIEFFKRLPPKEAIKVKNRVTSFFFGED